jgi:peptidoglycan-N-acetylglucosamine deacetylase
MIATPKFFYHLFPHRIWVKEGTEKIIYLTFDDGPIPEITPWVIEILEKYNAKATFFAVGDNAEKHTSILKETNAAGHKIGNHTYNHLNGWKTETKLYLENATKGRKVLEAALNEHVNLFRPPYGRLKESQANALLKANEIVMWSVLTKDYDTKTTAENCLKESVENTKNGSIVLFHDSQKAENNLKKALPQYLEIFKDLGYRFEVL